MQRWKFGAGKLKIKPFYVTPVPLFHIQSHSLWYRAAKSFAIYVLYSPVLWDADSLFNNQGNKRLRSSYNCVSAREKVGWWCCQNKPVIRKSPSRAPIIRAFPPRHSKATISLYYRNQMWGCLKLTTVITIKLSEWNNVYFPIRDVQSSRSECKCWVNLNIIQTTFY